MRKQKKGWECWWEGQWHYANAHTRGEARAIFKRMFGIRGRLPCKVNRVAG